MFSLPCIGGPTHTVKSFEGEEFVVPILIMYKYRNDYKYFGILGIVSH